MSPFLQFIYYYPLKEDLDMQENIDSIDNFDLSQAKRNMEKMLSESQVGAGVKKLFDPEVLKSEQMQSGNSTINIYPNNNGADNTLVMTNFLEKQRALDEKLTNIEMMLSSLSKNQKLIINNNSDSREKRLLEKRSITMISLIFAIATIFFIVLLPKNDSSQRVTSPNAVKIKETAQPIHEEMTKASKKQKSAVSLKFVNLRSLPSVNKGGIVKTIPPNQILKVLDDRNGWLKIEFTDHIQGRVSSGWVFGEFLKKVN